MEIDEDIHDPESNFENLVQQVKKQSEYCDVTVKFGDWSRKFHRCVLSASLLFQTIINAQIEENVKGNGDALTDTLLPVIKLEVKIDTSPDVVEMAIMSMYGIIPDFNIRNIGDFLQLADYFKTKELTDTCVEWLNNIDYSEVNCMHAVHLSRKYKFEITPCIEYIESHIPETFLNAEAVDLPTDFVENLFTDVKFSYVKMDDKLDFLVKLAKKHPRSLTEEVVVKLFNTIDLKDISDPAWEYAKNDIIFSGMVNLENAVQSKDQGNHRKCIMIIPSQEDYFACLDLHNDIWYRLNSDYFERYSYDEEKILGIRNNNPEVYFKGTYSWGEHLAVTTVDLESDQIRRYPIEMEFEGFLHGEIVDEDTTHVNFTNNTLIAIVKRTISMYECSVCSKSEPESELESEYESELERELESEPESELESELEYSNHEVGEESVNDSNEVFQATATPEIIPNTSKEDVSCMMQLQGISNSEPSTSTSGLSSSNCERDDEIIVTDVYIGNVSEEEDEGFEEVEMQPLFSFRKERITQICMNDLSVLALLTKSGRFMYVILYDLLEFKMERIFSVHEEKYELCATNNGFLLHNDSHCYCFTKQAGPVFSGSYKTEKFMLENNEDWFVKYHYQGGFWMRILRRSMHNDIELQYISHEDLTLCYASLDVNWRNVSMPEDKYLFQKVMNFENIFIVPISKEKLQCNIACPHCIYSEFF